jgi:hypothetical protein
MTAPSFAPKALPRLRTRAWLVRDFFLRAKLARHWNFNKLQDAPKGNQ